MKKFILQKSTLILATSILFVILFTGTIVFLINLKKNQFTLSQDDVVIIANPLKLSRVRSISKYRSCAGHLFATSDFMGEPEPASSAKHYVTPIEPLSDNDMVEVFAPFDGEIVFIDPNDTSNGQQFYIEQRPFKGWTFGFDHINMKKDLTKGSQVRAGQLLGYYTPPDPESSFDLILQGSKERGIYNHRSAETYTSHLDSMFNHMSSEVYQEYAEYGFTKEKMIISKADREKSPCFCVKGELNSTNCRFEGSQWSYDDYEKQQQDYTFSNRIDIQGLINERKAKKGW
jgi:hypothetical protein